MAGRRTDDIEADRARDNVAGTVADARIAEIVRWDWFTESDTPRSELALSTCYPIGALTRGLRYVDRADRV